MTPGTVVLDSEALSALATKRSTSSAALAALSSMRANDQRVVVPAVVLAELITGRPADAAIWHAVGRLVIQDITAPIAAAAGRLRERASAARLKKRDLTVDALVAATAASFAPSVLLTGDPADFALLAPEGVRIVAIP